MLASSRAFAAPTVADRETARALMDTGDRDVAQKDLPGALAAYRGADAIMHVPTTGIEVARVEEQLGMLLEARETALAVVRLPRDPKEGAAFTDARTAAADLAERLAARIPSIAVRVAGVAPGTVASLTVDGEAVPDAAIALPRLTNPGKHALVVSAPGYVTVRRDVSVAEKEHATVDVRLEPAPTDRPTDTPAPPPSNGAASTGPTVASAPHRDRALTYSLFGIGGAGLVIGAVTGGLSLAKVSSAGCTNDVCPAGRQGDVSSAKALAWTSDVAFGVGIAAAVAATVLYLTEPHESAAAPASGVRLTGAPTTSGAIVGVAGSF